MKRSKTIYTSDIADELYREREERLQRLFAEWAKPNDWEPPAVAADSRKGGDASAERTSPQEIAEPAADEREGM
jgi:hypothetical protein